MGAKAPSRIGGFGLSRYDLEEVVGGALSSVTGLQLRRLRERTRPLPDLSFRLHLEHEQGVLALRLGAAPLHRRPYRLSSVPGGLHPPVAFALSWLAELAPGHLCVDPFCGAGTIAIEAAFACPEARLVAVDLAWPALRATLTNSGRAGRPVLALRADAARLPLPDGSVDRLVSNPPWTNQVAYAGLLAEGRRPLWEEIARVLAPAGRAVLLGVTAADEPETDAAGLARRVLTRLSLFGTWTDVSLLARPS